MKMNTENIIFTGLSRAASDITSPDGELSVSHNIILDNGAMRPIWMPKATMQLEDGEKLVFIHQPSGRKNYIIRKGAKVGFFEDGKSERTYFTEFSSETSEVEFAAIGNTLVMSSDRGLEYILYKGNSYKNLGQKPPELDMSFKLSLTRLDPYYEVIKVNADGNHSKTTFDESVRNDVSLQITSKVNEIISKAESSNWFTATFFVRWAYRLYNGVYMASPPVMMPLNLGVSPLMSVLNANGIDNYTPDTEGALDDFSVRINGYKGRLQYEIPYFADVMSRLEDWKDIVTGVELYITRGIPRYDQNGTVKGIVLGDDSKQSVSYGASISIEDNIYVRNGILYDSSSYYIDGLHKSEEEYQTELLGNGIFYLLKSYKTEELENGTNDVELKENSISNITTSSILSSETDEYLEHDKLYPKGMYVYNKRLNIFGVSNEKYNFPLYSISAYTDGYVSLPSRNVDPASVEEGEGEEPDSGAPDVDVLPINTRKTYLYNIRFIISTEGDNISVTNINTDLRMYEPPLYLFYPDNNVTKAIIERCDIEENKWEQSEVSLTGHPVLQGSYWYGGSKPMSFKSIELSERLHEESAEDRRIYNGEKIYTSNVNNPFVFPLGGINTIGSGDIKGVATVTQALSQGQFGQFPLYVFSSDGVWAIEVGSDGLYSSITPVSRDVCINGNSITQTDNSVLFASQKGIMQIDGSRIFCISEMMNGRSFDPSKVCHLEEVFSKEEVPGDINELRDFMEYANSAAMAYDYANARILLYNSKKDYCYVYSMTGTTWATLGVRIESTVTDYPNIYIQEGNEIRNLSERIDYDDSERISTLIVTRPIKLGSNEFKTIYEVVARGAMDAENEAVLLWGSVDGDNYVLIADVMKNRIYRLGGRGYRYFRIGIVGKMNVGETLSMVSIGYKSKYQNRLR